MSMEFDRLTPRRHESRSFDGMTHIREDLSGRHGSACLFVCCWNRSIIERDPRLASYRTGLANDSFQKKQRTKATRWDLCLCVGSFFVKREKKSTRVSRCNDENDVTTERNFVQDTASERNST